MKRCLVLLLLPVVLFAASVDDLTFTLNYNYDGPSYSVTDCNEFATGGMIIPSTYNGLPVTSIGDWAFDYCWELTSVTIPNSVTSIGDYAFSRCDALTSITIPNSVTYIGWYAFSDCWSLSSITIPNSVTSIEDGAFSGCWSLSSITIPNSVTYIGWYAFSDCWSLSSITIPNSVTSIGDSAFYYCSSLTSITIPDSVTSIGSNAFGLTALSFLEDTNSIKYLISASGNKAYLIDGSSASGNVVLPSNFLGASVTLVADQAFYSCSSLSSITIPDSVTSIGGEAFSGCTSLTSITIPDSVTSIGGGAFADCSSLKNITFEGNAPSMSTLAFIDFEGLIALPQECIIYYYEGATGFTSPTWQGIQTETIYRTSAFTLGIEKQGTGFELWFNAANGVSYRIEYSTDLENWFTLEGNIIGAGGEIVRYYDTVGTQKRFYRAKRND